MPSESMRQAIPYVLLLALAGLTYWGAGHISYTARPGQLGPDVWPRLAAALIAAVCIYELVRSLTAQRQTIRGVAETLDKESQSAEEAPAYPKLLLAGGALTVAYGLAVPVLGFLLASFLYLVAFMYVGRYRAHAAIWISSLAGTALFALIFLKLVYVSLPRGVPPFDSITDWVTRVF